MKKKKNIFKRPIFYIGIIEVLTTFLLIFSIINIGILGLKYLIPIIIFLLLINSLIIYLLYKKIKIKGSKEPYVNKKGKTIDPLKKVKRKKIIIIIISILATIINIIASIILINLANSMNNLFKNESYINYSVIVNKKSNYKKINNLNKKIIGYYEGDKYSEEAEKNLSKKINVEYIGYATINELKYALITEEIDGIMIMDQYLDLDKENDEETVDKEIDKTEDDEINTKIKSFDKNTKIIYKFKIKVDNSKKTKKINLDKGSFVVYISGQDSYANEVSETSRSDVNMLMVVNLKTRQILLLTIPRDYYIKINSKGAYDKLTHISLYGPEEAANSLGNVLDVDIDYYVKFNFTTFMKATDFLLPLDVYSDYEFTTSVYDGTIGDCYTFYEGYNHITNSKQALQFVRARKNFSEGDRQRGINQTRFLRAVINKTTSPSVLIKYNKILKALEGTFLTNINDDSIVQIIKYILNHNGKFNISSISLDGSDAHRSTYSGGSQQLYVMIPNQNTINEASIQIKKVLKGEKTDIEKDKSELVDNKNTHNVTKAPTNYGTYQTTRKQNNTPQQEEIKENITTENKEEKDIEEETEEKTPTNPTEEEEQEPETPPEEQIEIEE